MSSAKIEMIKKILVKEPQSELLWFSLGQAYLADEAPSLAVEAFEKAIAIKPDYTVVYENLGGALEKIGKIEEAKEIYRKGIEVGQKTRDMFPSDRMTARLKQLLGK
jgi:tetratricopeptide (TPR) repeat protein